ncbi:tetraspanin-9-like isoform X2 [Ostrea edulis]|uniref:tetraspanin-9-like isoform X2 n=1 Tax=Ostrea edulis TaxID=37623 RepID=UPI0024AFDFA8|nr:tetraspanin-9-like isoform X2 [Ostrea edulis]
MGEGGCGKFGKVFLVVINLIFLLLGIGLLAAGVLVKVNAVSSDVTPALNEVSVAGFDLGDLANNLSILFIVVGAFIVVVSGLGLVGACCEVRCMLVVYAILVLILLIMKIAAVVLWFQMRNEFNEELKAVMKKSLDSSFINDTLDSSNAISNAWNYVFLLIDCCGINGTENEFEDTPWCNSVNSTCHDINAKIPRTCCTGVDDSNYLNADAVCYQQAKSYNTKGCFEAVKDLISSYGTAFIAISICIIVVELLAVVFAFVICRQAGSDSKTV